MNGQANRISKTAGWLRTDLAESLVCPHCGSRLSGETDAFRCAACEWDYPVIDGIPRLFAPDDDAPPGDVTEMVKAFYEETPFPNYDGLETVEDLRAKSRQGLFARLLDNQISLQARVLEVGCGTGQLTNFLAASGREVYGTDMCLNSLGLAQEFALRNGIERVAFIQMNLFKPVFPPGSFDLVISNGVLHHTSDPQGGFEAIGRLVKPGGHIIIGLYNTYGRLWTDWRRSVFKLFGRRARFLDPHLRKDAIGETKQEAWFADQYQHPHESKHTYGEALAWFEAAGFDFVMSLPKPRPLETFAEHDSLFSPIDPGTPLSRGLVQLLLFLRGGPEGGFFTMIGRKRGRPKKND